MRRTNDQVDLSAVPPALFGVENAAPVAAPVIHNEVPYSFNPKSKFWFWLPSGQWLLYRSIPNLLVLGVFATLFYALLSFIPLIFPVLLPVYAFPLIALGAALISYVFMENIRSLDKAFYKHILKRYYLKSDGEAEKMIEESGPLYKKPYRFILKFLFAKTEFEAKQIVGPLAEKRLFAQQLVDYIRYFFNIRLRKDEEENERLKIRIAKFNIRWGSAAKLTLNSFFLTTGLILLVPLIFGLSLTPPILIGLIAFGIFGGICSSLVVGNLLGNGLVALAKAPAKQSDVKAKPTALSRFDYWFGQAISLAHGLASGGSCFAAGMQLVMMLSAYSLIAANPFITPILLAFVGICSLLIARGFYAFTRKVWDNKAHSLKGFFGATDGDGKPIGSLQRIFGFLGAITIGIGISLAFVMLNGTSFAHVIQFPIYDVINSALRINLNPVALFSFIVTGVIGGIGVGIIYFTGIFKLSGDFGKFLDNWLSSHKPVEVVYNDRELEALVITELREKYNFREGDNEGPQYKPGFTSFFYRRHSSIERFIRAPIIIVMTALATGMLTTVPNVLVLMIIAPQLAIPVAIILFSITAFASMCKDYTNWLPGYENPSHAYAKAKEYLYQSKLLAKRAKDLEPLILDSEQLASIVDVPDNDSEGEEETDVIETRGLVTPAATPSALRRDSSSGLELDDEFWRKLSPYRADFPEIDTMYTHRRDLTYTEVTKRLTQLVGFCKSQSVQLNKRAEALRDGYDPHFYGLLLTGIVRVVSNLFALCLMPLALFIPEAKELKKPERRRSKSRRSLSDLASPAPGTVVVQSDLNPASAVSPEPSPRTVAVSVGEGELETDGLLPQSAVISQ